MGADAGREPEPRRAARAPALTSAVHLAQVGEAPHIAQAHGIRDAGEHELQRVGPQRPRFLHGPGARALASRWGACSAVSVPGSQACGPAPARPGGGPAPSPRPLARFLIANLINDAPVGGARLVNG